jgi:hypothetical protein
MPYMASSSPVKGVCQAGAGLHVDTYWRGGLPVSLVLAKASTDR